MAKVDNINGTSKITDASGRLIYLFPNGQTAAVQNNSIDWGIKGTDFVPFTLITDAGGATNAEEYLDSIASTGTDFSLSLGNVEISNLPAVQEVSGTVDIGNFPSLQVVEVNSGASTMTGKIAVADFETLIDLKMLYSSLPLQYGQALGGGGTATYDITKSSVDFAVTTTGDYAIRQTKVRFNYRSGKTQVFMFTVAGLQSQTGVEKRVGCFNGGQVAPYNTYDGIFIKSTPSGYFLSICNAGTEIEIPRADWFDKLDGTGGSGLNLDWSKEQLFEINFLWFGIGGVRAYVYYNDKKYLFIKKSFANERTKPFMLSPNQPMRFELRSTGGAGTLMQGCITVGSFGGGTKFTKKLGVDSLGNITLANTANWYLLYAFRLVSTRLDAMTKLGEFAILPTNNNDIQYCVVLNPTFSAAPTYATATYFDVEIALGNGTIIATDRNFVAYTGITQQRVTSDINEDENNIRFGSDVNGTADVIAILARPVGANATVRCVANIISDR